MLPGSLERNIADDGQNSMTPAEPTERRKAFGYSQTAMPVTFNDRD